MKTLALKVKHLTVAWIKAHVGTEAMIKLTKRLKRVQPEDHIWRKLKASIPWQLAKIKIEDYTTSKWKQKWISAPQYKHTKLFYDSPNKNKSIYIFKMGTYMLSIWIKSITGHNSLAYFQSKLKPEIDPTCWLYLQSNETLHHLMTDCKATTSLQLNIMKNQIPLPDMTWSVKDIN